MLYEIVVELLGPCPVGLEFLYLTFAFILSIFCFLLVFVIFNSFFKIFKKGR